MHCYECLSAPSPSSFAVQQTDVFFKTLTVREHLLIQAKLRMPRHLNLSESQQAQRVDQVLDDMGLIKCRDSKIGDVGLNGISGGERRRLSFATEILTEKSLLFCDER